MLAVQPCKEPGISGLNKMKYILKRGYLGTDALGQHKNYKYCMRF